MLAPPRSRSLLTWSFMLSVLSSSAETASAADQKRTPQPGETDKMSLSQLVGETSLEDPNCRKIRRMLWVEKEGWVVRKTRVCT